MYNKNMPRDKHIELLTAVATREVWTDVRELHRVAGAYKTVSSTSQALNTLICYKMVEGTRSRSGDSVHISSLGKAVLAAPPERQVNFFRRKREPVAAKIEVCESCGKHAPLFLWRKRRICEDCLNPKYEPSYTDRRVSPTGFEV